MDVISDRVPASEPLYVLNTQDFTSSSGDVQLSYGDDILGMWGSRSVTYDVNVTEADTYFFQVSSAHLSSGSIAPDADYRFQIAVYLDNEFVGFFDLSTDRVYLPSDYIALGELEAGTHSLTIDWVNAVIDPGVYDTNLGLKELAIFGLAP